jgi:hypothetical protein
MAVIGFFALLLLGLVLVAHSLAMMFFSKCFAGRFLGNGVGDAVYLLAFLIAGIVLVYLAITNVPFSVVVQ